MKQHSIKTQDGQRIAFHHRENGHTKVVIITHGFFNSKDAELLCQLEEALGDQYDVVNMDFRGHGKSSGLFYWTAKEYLDLEAVLEYTSQNYQQIGVIGFSLGAATSLIAASRSELMKSVIAVSPPSEFSKIEYHFWGIDIENDILYNWFGRGKTGKKVWPGPFWLKKYKPIEIVDKIKCPVFYLHGETDWLIKPWHSQALFDKTKSKKKITVIKNGLHAEYLIRKNKTETVELIKSWFQETM